MGWRLGAASGRGFRWVGWDGLVGISEKSKKHVTGEQPRLSYVVRRHSPFYASRSRLSIGTCSSSRQEGKNMAETFGATSTTEEVLSSIDLHGKRILVTGVSAGLGVET